MDSAMWMKNGSTQTHILRELVAGCIAVHLLGCTQGRDLPHEAGKMAFGAFPTSHNWGPKKKNLSRGWQYHKSVTGRRGPRAFPRRALPFPTHGLRKPQPLLPQAAGSAVAGQQFVCWRYQSPSHPVQEPLGAQPPRAAGPPGVPLHLQALVPRTRWRWKRELTWHLFTPSGHPVERGIFLI